MNMRDYVLPNVLNCTFEAMGLVFPVSFTREKLEVITQYIHSEELGVLIGLTHDLHGRLIIEGRVPVFQRLSEAMYGMKLTGAMLESFVGELGNMIAGNMSSRLAEQGAHVEISPPTVMVGPTKLTGFTTAAKIPVDLLNVGRIHLILILDEMDI